MTIRFLPVGIALSFLAMTPAHAQTLSCGPLLDGAIDAPIPEVLVSANTIVTFEGAEGILRLLSKHVASIPIEWMPGAYVGLDDDVSGCIADGCDAFVFVASNGIAAVSRMLRIDSHSTLRVWDYHTGVVDQYILPPTFANHGIDYRQQTIAMIVSNLTEINIYWAGLDEVLEEVDSWISRGDGYAEIPFYLLSETGRRTPFVCP